MAVLPFTARIVDRSTIDARRRSRLEARHLQAACFQRLGKVDRRPLPRTARPLRRGAPHMDPATEKGPSRDDHGLALEGHAPARFDAPDATVDVEPRHHLLEEIEVIQSVKDASNGDRIERSVALRPRPPHRGALRLV